MAISVICAWIAVLCVILTALKYGVKRNKRINRLFRRIHIPAGSLLIAAGLIHGLFAGNAAGTSLGQISFGEELFSLNLGTLCFLLTVALGLSYCFRRKLKKAWIRIHRVLTVMLLVVLVLHVAQVGITLPELFRAGSGEQASAQTEETVKETLPEPEQSNTAEGETISEPQQNMLEEEETGTEVNVTGDSEEVPEPMTITFSGAKLMDGTYEGSAEGFKGMIQVSVTVEGGAVTAVDVVSQRETPKYWSRASRLLETIVSEQSLEVDAVSGATYSSKGILCAVNDALEDAVSEGVLQITVPQTNGKRH